MLIEINAIDSCFINRDYHSVQYIFTLKINDPLLQILEQYIMFY